jgi:predicted TIM-barrel fold metal-dependent hydrolase
MLRRDFLAGSGSPVFAGLSTPLAFGDTQFFPEKIIDVHCHVFNADDLPIADFIEKTSARTFLNTKEATPYAPLIDLMLVDIAKRLQDEAKDEEHFLDVIKAHPRRARSQGTIRETERRFVIKLLDGWYNNPGKPLPPRSTLIEKIINTYLPRVILGLIFREMILQVPVDLNHGAGLNDIDDTAFRNDLSNNADYLGGQIYDHPKGPISRNIKWAVSFTRYRHELLKELARVNHRRAVLVTPALLDFTKWLNASDEATPMTVSRQVALMSRLSRERPAGVPHVHCFVPFDPLRQAIHDKGSGPPAESPLAIVKKAIMQQGFIGVKLYPPMGFRASNNVGAGNAFPCWVRFGRDSRGKVSPRSGVPDDYGVACIGGGPGGLGNEPGATLDAVMMRLFKWCSDNNVPIMAHTTNTHDAGDGYGKRADPRYWQPVLKIFPGLRVNFAHFGGFDKAIADDRLNVAKLPQTWEWTIGRMAKAMPNQIFADISYASEILDARSQKYKNALICMRRFHDHFPSSERLLMYGTDWSMIGHEEKFSTIPQPLPDLIGKYLSEAGYGEKDRDSIFFGNAVRFLGLGKADATRARLEQFYGTPAAGAWLRDFDSVN